jgi:hypothetical protein
MGGLGLEPGAGVPESAGCLARAQCTPHSVDSPAAPRWIKFVEEAVLAELHAMAERWVEDKDRQRLETLRPSSAV